MGCRQGKSVWMLPYKQAGHCATDESRQYRLDSQRCRIVNLKCTLAHTEERLRATVAHVTGPQKALGEQSNRSRETSLKISDRHRSSTPSPRPARPLHFELKFSVRQQKAVSCSSLGHCPEFLSRTETISSKCEARVCWDSN